MGVAILRVLEEDRRYADIAAYRIEIDCPHAVTGVSRLGSQDTVSNSDAVRLALARHHVEEQCGCIRKLWREYFGVRWPEIPLVVCP